MAKLTYAECRAAASAARRFPPGQSKSFFALTGPVRLSADVEASPANPGPLGFARSSVRALADGVVDLEAG
jgi:hypothetical protein